LHTQLISALIIPDRRVGVNFAAADTFVAGGGFGIVKVDSHERVWEMLHEDPGYAFFEWEVHPLCDYKTTGNKFIEMLRKQGM
jgi:hypothetical protein